MENLDLKRLAGKLLIMQERGGRPIEGEPFSYEETQFFFKDTKHRSMRSLTFLEDELFSCEGT